MPAPKNGARPQICFSATHFVIVTDLQYYPKIYVLGVRILDESVTDTLLVNESPQIQDTVPANHAQ